MDALAFTAALLLSSSLCLAGDAGVVLHVDDDAPPGGDGLTWDTAFRFLQDALEAAGEGTEVRVGEGVYYPDRSEAAPDGSGDRAASFWLAEQVRLVGGYAGFGAAVPDARDVDLYESILSGDLEDNDVFGFANREDNSLTLIRVSVLELEPVTLDGFTVTASNNDADAYPDGFGGGIFTEGAVIVANCRFTFNEALAGSAIYQHSQPTRIEIHNSVFSDNRGTAVYTPEGLRCTRCVFRDNETTGDAAALYCRSDARILHSTFAANHARQNGGAIWGKGVHAELCTFIGNSSAAYGGAVFMPGFNGNAMVSCTFLSNSAGLGGGAGFLSDHSPVLIDNCTFSGNSTEGEGGALYIAHPAHDLTIDGCSFISNSAPSGGGMFVDGGGALSLLNATFEYNVADTGGALYLLETRQDNIIDGCTFQENSALLGGGVYFSDIDGAISHSLFRNNFADAGGGAYAHLGTPGLSHCIFEHNQATIGGGLGSQLAEVDVEEVIFIDNTATLHGGAIDQEGGVLRLSHSLLADNSAGSKGGGVDLFAANFSALGCDFTGNLAGDDGGAVHSILADSIVQRSSFFMNEAAVGGAVYQFASGDSQSRFRWCRFAANEADHGAALIATLADVEIACCVINGNQSTFGSAIRSTYSAPQIINCTVYGNENSTEDGSAGITGGGTVVQNSILWANRPEQAGAGVLIEFSNNEDDCEGVGNISIEPRFVDPIGRDGLPGTPDDDLRLRQGSPCIDAGNNAAVPPDVMLDLAGGDRFVDDPGMPDIGLGDPPIVDMGAYEFDGITTCVADLDGDGAVGLTDLLPLLDDWGDCTACRGDLDRDCSVTLQDLLALLGSWGPCPTAE